MSRIALITDLHGNLGALHAALEDIEKQRCDSIYCLGDLIEGGAENEEVVREIMRLEIPTVRGNHDENYDVPLPNDCARFLASLPEHIVIGDILLVHISPRPEKSKIRDIFDAWNVFDESEYRMIFYGHVHLPLLFGERSSKRFEAREYSIRYGEPIALDRGDRYLICAGALGYARDSHTKPRYVIYDDSALTLTFRSIEGPLIDRKSLSVFQKFFDEMGDKEPGT